jgi:hypothetical protein
MGVKEQRRRIYFHKERPDGGLKYSEPIVKKDVSPLFSLLLMAPKGAVCQIVGGVISPLLANVYLHYVLDVWFEEVVKPRLKGRAFLVRYADDFVMGFAREEDARNVLAVLPQRLGKYGLTIHPEKTRLVPFERLGRDSAAAGSKATPQPGSFDFLGFTHYWSRSKRGNWMVKRKTAGSRFHRAVQRIDGWCRLNRHRSMAEQHQTLWQKLRGHFAYYGVIGNLRCLSRFRYEVMRSWRKWLSRRKRRGRLTWSRFNELLKAFPLPRPRAAASAEAAKP